ncbi:histidine kinase [Mastigocoleus testarum BC008]|uniref:Circadian input-output histidine kinase CikA n=1 Tax=Mastigocoleus testarum BC008 TaxID=371196 RepID=A0A0V7ZCB7_9CYAN|nr:histidine kinase [Mastigocoleus testarum BC008]
MSHLTTLNRIVSRIRQSLNLQTVLDSTTTEVRRLLKTDRVKIYKFDEQGNGQVVAESINRDRLPSLKGLYFPAGDIPPQARELFVKAKVRSIVNLEEQKIRLLEPSHFLSTSAEELTVEQVRKEPLKKLLQRPVDPCHVEYLNLMGVKSTLVVPILKDKKLWGLLIAHHGKSKRFSQLDLQIIQMITEQLELAISQANLMEDVEANARREKLISDISFRIYLSVETEKILQKVLREVVREIQASGGIVLLTQTLKDKEFLITGSQVQLSFQQWLELFKSAEITNRSKVITDIYQEQKLNKFISAFTNTHIRSILVVPLRYSQEVLGYLAVFRDEINVERVWAGYNDPDKRQQRPRQSFEQWKEMKTAQVPEWSEGDQKLLESLGNHFTMAILQHTLYQREKQQRFLVEEHNRKLQVARTVAETASRLKSEFLSTTNHELRTPIASTLNYLTLLRERLYDNEEELEEYIEAAYTSAENLVNIINNVLDISKIEAGRMQVDLKFIKLQPLLDKQRSLFKAQTIGCNLNFVMKSEVDAIWADENKLQQILINLISNAFKFTREGEIKLEVLRCITSEKPEIQFSVSDTGIGIEPNKQNILFEAFVQADGSIRRRYGGTGLGLTICKNFVELMGGKIWLESPGLNQGTTVTFTLPVNEPLTS